MVLAPQTKLNPTASQVKKSSGTIRICVANSAKPNHEIEEICSEKKLKRMSASAMSANPTKLKTNAAIAQRSNFLGAFLSALEWATGRAIGIGSGYISLLLGTD